MKNIAIFASGSGSNMQSIIDAINSKDIKAQIKAVIVNKKEIFAINRAQKENIPVYTFLLKDYKDKIKRDTAIVDVLKEYKIDYIILAGYLGILTEPLLNAYDKKIINIHPSLLPKHGGNGMYGMKVHESVIESGDKISGCTVHFVDKGTDTGKIIKQVIVKLDEGETASSLQKKVLEQEHKLLVQVVQDLCNKEE